MQTSQNSARERLLQLILPAAIVVIAYAWFWHGPQVRTLQARQEKVEKATASPFTPDKLFDAQQNLQDLQTEVARLQKEAQALDGSRSSATPTLVSSLPPTEAALTLSRLMESCQLTVIDTDVLDNQSESSVVPPTLRSAVESLRRAGGARPPTLYCVRFAGRYPDVLALLQQIESNRIALPLQVHMQEADTESTHREWTLYAWL